MNDRQLLEVLEGQQQVVARTAFWLLFAYAWLIALTVAGAVTTLRELVQ